MRGNCKHCFACNKCVLDFDNHCSLLNNCYNNGNRIGFIAFISSILGFFFSLATISLMHFQKPSFILQSAIRPENLPESGEDKDAPF
jgi:hypothetical protein